MQNENGLTPAERELEAALATLSPAAAIDRDRLMFRAGQASVRSGRRLWQATAAALMVALVASVSIRLTPRPSAPSSFMVESTHPAAPGPSTLEVVVGDAGDLEHRAQYLRLTNRVLLDGVDVLPTPRASASTRENPMRIERLVPISPAHKRGFFGIEKWIDFGAQSS